MPGFFMQKELRPLLKMQPILFLDLPSAVFDESTENSGVIILAARGGVKAGVHELIEHYIRSGYTIVGIANEPDVALGKTRIPDVNKKMLDLNHNLVGAFDAIIYCPHHPDAKEPENQSCMCRLPKYGMLMMAKQMLEQGYQCHFPNHLMQLVGPEELRETAAAAGVKFTPVKDWLAESIALKISPKHATERMN